MENNEHMKDPSRATAHPPHNLPSGDHESEHGDRSKIEISEKKESKNQELKNNATKVLAVLGLAGILALVSFGIVKYGPQGVKRLAAGAATLSSKFIPGNNRFAVSSTNYAVESGDTFTLAFKNPSNESGYYTVTFECVKGLSLEIKTSVGRTPIECDKKFELAQKAEIAVVAFSTNKRFADAKIKAAYVRNSDEKILGEDEIVVTVSNKGIDESPAISATPRATPTPIPTSFRPRVTTRATPPPYYYYPTATVIPVPIEDPNGAPDFKVTILETGKLNSNKEFVSDSEIRRSETAAVKFVVQNVGTKRTGSWEFEAKLPTSARYTYNSRSQRSLMPGDKIEYTLGFDEIRSADEIEITITVDPDDDIDELSERNNEDSATIDIDR